VIIIITSNFASDVITQTAGTPWTVLDINSNNGGTVGLTTSLWYRKWEGTETAPTWTWGTSTRNSYSVAAFAPDAGYMIFPDRWGSIKKDTTAATTHTPNAYTITSPFTDCIAVFAGAVASAVGNTTFTQTASTSFTMNAASKEVNIGTTGQFVYGCNMEYFTGQTTGATPAAETISGGSGAGGTTQATLYTVSIREIQISAYPFRVVQTAYGPNATSVSFAAPTTAGNTVLALLSLANGTTALPAVSGVTLGGAADNFFAVQEKAQATASTTAYYAGIWADLNCAGGQTAVAYSGSNFSNGASVGIIALEVSGIYPSVALCTDQETNASAQASTACAVTASTTVQANEFWVAFMGGGAGNSTSSGPNPNGGQVGLHLSFNMEGGAYSLATATGIPSFSATLKASSAWAAVVATFVSGRVVFPAALATSASFPAVTVNAGSGITPAALAVTTAFSAPTVRAGSGVAPAALTTSASFPAVSIRADQIRSQPALAVSASFPAVTVTAGASATVAPPSLAVSAGFAAPSIRADQTAAPSSLAVSVSFPAPAISAGAIVTTTALPVSASFPAPVVSAGSVVTATALATAASFPAPTVNTGTSVTVTPSVLAVSTSFSAPAVNAGTSVTPASLAVSASFPARTIRADQAVTPASLAVSASFPAPVVGQGQAAVPAALSASASFPARTVSQGQAVTPAALAASTSFAAPQPNAGASVTPGSLAAGTAFAVSSIRADQAASPASLPASASFPARTVSQGQAAAPAALAVSASFPALLIRADQSVTPASLAASTSFSAPLIRADQSVTPAALAVPASFPAAQPNAGSSVTPAALAVSASFAAPAVDPVRPATLAVSASFPAPRVDPVTPALLAVSASFPAPAIQAGSAVPVTTLVLAAILTPPVVQTGTSAVIPPPLFALGTRFAAPAVRADQKLTASSLATSTS
jgi:hypothetical protein